MVSSIIRTWRELTAPAQLREMPALPGQLGRTIPARPADSRRTLIACSGGADSSALVLALAAASRNLVVAHIVHDLRPVEASHADCGSATALAQAVGLPFVNATIQVRGTAENLESRARRLRYAALAKLAQESDCPFIATAHHGDDQLETVLMALIRGAGPRGLRGIARTRPLLATDNAPLIRIIRPMLGSADGRSRAPGHRDCEQLCRDAGWSWSEDLTNGDTTLFRNRLRAEVIPRLKLMQPQCVHRVVATAIMQQDVFEITQQLSTSIDHTLEGQTTQWSRRALRTQSSVIIGEALSTAVMRVTNGTSRDRLGQRTLGPVIRAVCSCSTDPRRFELAGSVEVLVDAHIVLVRARTAKP